MIKKDLTISIRKHVNELKVHKKTIRTAIKQDLSRDLNTLDYAIWGVLENKTIATSHPNIGSFTTAVEEEWNKMSEEFILKACKSFWRRVDTIIEKKMAAILSKFTVLCLSFYFVVYLLKLILFYDRILEAAHHKTAYVLPLTSHLTNHYGKINKTCWRSRDKLKVFLWTFTHRHTGVGWLTKTCIGGIPLV